jgi:hypothetical protein
MIYNDTLYGLIIKGLLWMVISTLSSQNFRFQITIYLEENWDFLAYKHIHVCTEIGCTYFFYKNILETN